MKRFLSALAAILLGACPCSRAGNPEPPDDADAACDRLHALQCKSVDGRELWAPTREGHSCPEVFRNASRAGVNLHPECIAKMQTCDERDACTGQD